MVLAMPDSGGGFDALSVGQPDTNGELDALDNYIKRKCQEKLKTLPNVSDGQEWMQDCTNRMQNGGNA